MARSASVQVSVCMISSSARHVPGPWISYSEHLAERPYDTKVAVFRSTIIFSVFLL